MSAPRSKPGDRMIAAQVLHALGLRWPNARAFRSDGYLSENPVGTVNDRLYSREEIEALIVTMMEKIGHPLDALKDATAYRYLRAHGQCDSKHGNGIELGGDKLKAKMSFRFWCEPEELDKLIHEAVTKEKRDA